MFTRRSLIAILAVALAPLLAPGGALAAGRRLERAIWETEEALDAGRRGQGSSLVEHAVEAADHARLAIRQNPQARITIDRGVAHLDRAIRLARRTHSRRRLAAAVRHVERALFQFEAAMMRIEGRGRR